MISISQLLISSKINKRLLELINVYDREVIDPYTSFFVTREGKLESLLNDDFFKIKDSIDEEMIVINKMFDLLDSDNITEHKLMLICDKMFSLSTYISYIVNHWDSNLGLEHPF